MTLMTGPGWFDEVAGPGRISGLDTLADKGSGGTLGTVDKGRVGYVVRCPT